MRNCSHATQIGELDGLARDIAGTFDEIGFWSRALSSEEILMLYNGGTGLSYPFDSSTGSSNRFLRINNVAYSTLSKFMNVSLTGVSKINGLSVTS
jgi:hypothetical protein